MPEPQVTTARKAPVANLQTRIPRAQLRADFRHRIQIIQLRHGSSRVEPTITSGWIEDISSTGAKLLIPQGVQADRFWVRLNDGVAFISFIECNVCWRDVGRVPQNSSAYSPFDACGVKFAQTLTQAEFDRLMAVAHPLTPDTAPVSAVLPQ